MEEIIKKAIAKALMEPVKQARENSVFGEKGRIFLDASASLYGASVSDGLLIDAKGNIMTEKDPDYNNIIRMAKKQARAESAIGRDIIGS